jgi:Ras-related protein Rab-5C
MAAPATDIKIVLIGATGVGKTCVVKRATTGVFEGGTMPTLGASYTSKVVSVNAETARLLIWDTAGQERYRGITHMYYRNAVAAILVYGINELESFKQIDSWLQSLQDNTPPGVLLFLVGNKSDLDDARQVSIQDAQDKATAIGAEFSEVSAKTGLGIEELFVCIASKSLEKATPAQPATGPTTIDVGQASPDAQKGCC